MGLYDRESLIKVPAESLDQHAASFRSMAEGCRRSAASYAQWAEDNRARAEDHDRMAVRFEEAAAERRALDAERHQERVAALPPVRHRVMCGVATKRGLPCIRRVLSEGERCWWHGGPRLAQDGSKDASGGSR